MVKGIFEAKSFAVIGASHEELKVGHVIFNNLIEKGIKAYPINPNSQEVLGIKCFKNIKDVNEKVDCAIIAIKAEFVPNALKECGEKKIKNVVVISAGFSEAGNIDLENEMIEICKKYNINLLGPNSLGFINPITNTNASFFATLPKKGKIAFLSQSGAIGTAVLDMDIGFSGFVSLGNSNILDFSDFIEYFSNDKNTEVITLYIESIKKDKGKRFMEACKKCKKPIIAIKAGKSDFGKRAASSHTAALASTEGVYEGIFKQCGIIEVDSMKQMFQAAEVLVKYKAIGKNACIVTNAGGPGVLVSDYCYKYGLNLPDLPDNVIKKLNNILPIGWSKNNPVDILGDAKSLEYYKTLKTLENEKFFDFFIVILTPQYMTEPEKTAEVLNGSLKKPVIACFLGGEKVDAAIVRLNDEDVLVFKELKEMVEVLGKICK